MMSIGLRVVIPGAVPITTKLTGRYNMVKLGFDNEHSLLISGILPHELEIDPAPIKRGDFGKDLNGCQTAPVNAKFSIAESERTQKRLYPKRPRLDSASIQKLRQGLGRDPFGKGHFPIQAWLHQTTVGPVKTEETPSAIKAGSALPVRSIADELFDPSTCTTKKPSRCFDDRC